MLLLTTRRTGEKIFVELDPVIDPDTPVGHFFTAGPIEILVTAIAGKAVRVGIKCDTRYNRPRIQQA